MFAVEALYDGVHFKPTQPIPVSEDYKVIITFLEPVKTKTIQKPAIRPPFDFGCLKSQAKEAPDHDWFTPLEDFEDYLQ